jgi:hypothetical protein
MRYCRFLLPALLLPGCMAEVLTTAAIQADLQAKQAGAAQQTLSNVKSDTGQMNLQRAVDLYQAEKGSLPTSLDMLVPNFIDAIPPRGDGGAFGYNPLTGKVLETDAGPTAADYLMMEQIKTAINAYGTATGLYPPTLDTLNQSGYLPVPPRTESGQPFNYNNQNGAVSHPLDGPVAAAVAAQTARPGGGAIGVGGGGPLGEVTTGIAMQEELNRSSNAGSAAAGTRGRTSSRSAAAEQGQRQEKALDELGF